MSESERFTIRGSGEREMLPEGGISFLDEVRDARAAAFERLTVREAMDEVHWDYDPTQEAIRDGTVMVSSFFDGFPWSGLI